MFQEFQVVPTRVNQTESQPESRQKGLRYKNKRLPIGDFLGHPIRARLIPPSALSIASVAIPAKKHQLASERRLRIGATRAKTPLKSAAAKASKESEVIREQGARSGRGREVDQTSEVNQKSEIFRGEFRKS